VSSLRFTVLIPPEHRNTLLDQVRREIRRSLVWAESAPADVVVGCPGEGRMAGCPVWPGPEGALALVEAAWERSKDQVHMARLNEVGRSLASEQNLDRLLDLVLRLGRELLAAEAGSIYLVTGEDDRELLFAHTQNAKLNLPFHRFKMPISTSSMAGFVAETGEVLNIEDVYRIPGDAPYHFNDSFDKQAGYRTQSMLVVPMQDTEGRMLGVLQFINRVETEGLEPRLVPFLKEHRDLAISLAGQAGVAVRNAQLREEIEVLFEGFVNASVTAIEARDPVTSGHSGRVAGLTVGLAEAINATPNGLYGDLFFSDRQLREIRYASLLHDFGKVGVREQVLVKAKKLQPEKLEVILQRLRQRHLEDALDLLRQAWGQGTTFDEGRWAELLRSRSEETEALIQLVLKSNEPTVLAQESTEGLHRLGLMDYGHWDGSRRALVDPKDLACLGIRKGSLSEEERLEIESHVTHTYRFLQQIPWTRDLGAVPEIAYAHHERLTGTGYPRRLAEKDIPVQSKAMAISDVFDALTARDRPYKGAVPLEKSLAILEEEARGGHLDRALLDLFIEARLWERVMKAS